MTTAKAFASEITAKKKATAGVAAKVQDTPAAIDWDSLPDAEVVEYRRVGGGKPSIAETTPEFVKARVFAAYVASVETGAPVFRRQTLPSVETAEEFEKLMRRWARHESKTVKGKVDGTAFVYAVVDAQKRPRKTVEKP